MKRSSWAARLALHPTNGAFHAEVETLAALHDRSCPVQIAHMPACSRVRTTGIVDCCADSARIHYSFNVHSSRFALRATLKPCSNVSPILAAARRERNAVRYSLSLDTCVCSCWRSFSTCFRASA